MELKDFIGILLLAAATLCALLGAAASRKIASALFFFIVAGLVVTDRLDVNPLSTEWYRGTTRGVELSLIDAAAVGLLFGTVLRGGRSERIYWPAGLSLLVIYLLYAAASVATSSPHLFGVFELSKIFRGILVFLATAYFVRSEKDLQVLISALACAMLLEGMLAVKQRIIGMDRVAGSFWHPNGLSMYVCMAGPVLAASISARTPAWLRALCWAAVGAAAVAILLTLSRAGLPIFAIVMLGAAVFCGALKITVKRAAIAIVVAIAAAALVSKGWSGIKARYHESTMEEEYLDQHTDGRGHYLRLAAAIKDDRFFGVGLNNWSYWVSKLYGGQIGMKYDDYDSGEVVGRPAQYAPPAHNLGALTLGELGVPGFVIFTLLWMRWLQMCVGFLWRKKDTLMTRVGVGIFFGMCGVFMQSLTEWLYRQSPIFFTFHVLLGTAASLHYLRRSHPVAPRLRAFPSPQKRILEPACVSPTY